MKLLDLNPEWRDGTNDRQRLYLCFECPKCSKEDCCTINLPVSLTGQPKPNWKWNGDRAFDNVTVEPSVWHHCSSDPHFFIRNGEIVWA